MKEVQLKRRPFCGAHATQPQNVTPGKRLTWEIACAVFCSFLRRGSRAEVIRDWNKRAAIPDAPDGCYVNIFSSRVCENGTLSCVTEHLQKSK